jgi:phage gpG-like protein
MLSIKSDFKFDRRKIERAMRDNSIRSLGHGGAAIRLAARRSIRRSKKSSRVGTPPHTRFGQLKRSLRYSVEKARQSVLIGPTYSVVGRSAAAHEFGGRYHKQIYPKRPLMGPALNKIAPRLPKLWAGSIR